MKKFAVGYINFHDNDMVTEIVEADSWQEALVLHSLITSDSYDTTDSTLEQMKCHAFDMDEMIDIVEVM